MAADFWYDGQKQRPLHKDAHLVAQLTYPELAAATSRQAAASSAKEQLGELTPKVRLVRLQQQDPNREAVTRSSQPDRVALTQVEVYRDSPRGPLRVAIGGVLLRLQPQLSLPEQENWLAQAGLLPLGASPAYAGHWLVASPPGEASLALANRLQTEAVVVSASPNWWQPREKR